MRRKTMKAAALAVFAGTVLQFSGCLGGLLQLAVVEVIAEQVAGFVNFGNLLGGGDTTAQ